jgi:hypothetical protein
MIYEFLTDEVLIKKFVRVELQYIVDFVTRRINDKNEIEFMFIYKDGRFATSYLITLNEETLKDFFIKDFRKAKLLKIYENN